MGASLAGSCAKPRARIDIAVQAHGHACFFPSVEEVGDAKITHRRYEIALMITETLTTFVSNSYLRFHFGDPARTFRIG
jgi:hypothetical protein